ncbi:MAG: H-NS histone family protein, partial [Bradyrhizobium sp.]|nr:H-NS histone family protein [Bradyrhizobium sp.]
DLEKQIVQIKDLNVGARRGRKPSRSSSLKGRKAEPKYRNSANPKETWAGRGMKPRWLTAALKSGKKIESFEIKK